MTTDEKHPSSSFSQDMKMIRFVATAAVLAFGVSAFADGDADNSQKAPTSDLQQVSVNASDPVAFRGLSSGAFIVHRDDTNKDLTIKLAAGGSAVSGTDYQPLPGSVTIPAGFYSVGLTVNPLGGASAAPTRGVTLSILEDPAYEVGRPSKATVEIKGNVYEDQAPVVSITSPPDNSSFLSHTALTITADASDADANDAVAKVSFYANDRFLGSTSTKPYSVTWDNLPPGSFSLFARAEDQLGKSSLSTAVHITVTNPPPSTAKVALSAPTAGNSFSAGANITLEAKVTSANPVKSVSFYSGDKLLGTDDTEPYSFTWNNVSPGHYTLRAKVLGTDGSSASSESVKITVNNILPKVSILTPEDKAIVGGPKDIEIKADASDTDGIAKVMIYGDGKALGSVTAPPYIVTWPNVAPGKHVIIATAFDAFGGFSSAAATITVTNPLPKVSITSPAEGANFTAPGTIEIKADASDDDPLQYVSFWVGDRRLGTDTTAPYSFTVDKLEPGTYTLTAHAIDKFGQRSLSAPVKVTVAKP
jgi:hypothetical protein